MRVVRLLTLGVGVMLCYVMLCYVLSCRDIFLGATTFDIEISTPPVFVRKSASGRWERLGRPPCLQASASLQVLRSARLDLPKLQLTGAAGYLAPGTRLSVYSYLRPVENYQNG